MGFLKPANSDIHILRIKFDTYPTPFCLLGCKKGSSASQKRINEFLNVPVEITETEHLKHPIKGNISFANVNFIYPDTGIHALKNIKCAFRCPFRPRLHSFAFAAKRLQCGRLRKIVRLWICQNRPCGRLSGCKIAKSPR